eukprot:gene11425-12774_t
MASTSTTVRDAYVSSKGYAVPKAGLTPEELQAVRSELTVRPFSAGAEKRGLSLPSYTAFRESANTLFVPRFFGEARWGPAPLARSLLSPRPLSATYCGPPLFANQQRAVDAFLGALRVAEDGLPTGGGIINLYCGGGKTNTALHIAGVNLRWRNIWILAHNISLITQWEDRLKSVYPAASVGLWRGATCDVDDKDFVIASVQTVCREGPPIPGISLLIVDEVHHISSTTFSRALFRLVPRVALGLSATLDRNDRTEHVYRWFIGDPVYSERRPPNAQVLVHQRVFTPRFSTAEERAAYLEMPMSDRGELLYSTLQQRVLRHPQRIQYLIDLLIDHLAKTPHDAAALRQRSFEAVPCVVCGTIAPPGGRGGHAAPPKKRRRRAAGSEASSAVFPDRSPRCYACACRCRCRQCNAFCLPQPCGEPTEGRETYSVQERHTIVLLESNDVLEQLHRIILERRLFTAGLFCSKVPPPARTPGLECQVILGTYGLGGEALDVPTLNTLVLASSRLVVIQPSGRIQRRPHEHTRPTIFDIVDPHPPFRNHGRQRAKYYQQEGYEMA